MVQGETCCRIHGTGHDPDFRAISASIHRTDRSSQLGFWDFQEPPPWPQGAEVRETCQFRLLKQIHRLKSLNSISFSHCGSWKSKVKVLAASVSGVDPFPASQISHCILKWWGLSEREVWSLFLLIRTQIPSWGAPSLTISFKPKYLSKASPPDPIMSQI